MQISVWLRRTVLPACVLIPMAAAILHNGPFTSQAGNDLKTSTVTPDERLRPAGTLLLDAETKLPAVVPLTVSFLRTPDGLGPDGRGRYLIAINSGYGLEFNSRSKGNQSLSVIDLNAKPEPVVIQNIYFQSPQSANVGLALDKKQQPDGSYRLYVAGGYENKVWMLAYDPEKAQPLYPANKPDTKVDAPSIDVSAFAESAPSPYYNDNVAAVYPTGLALSPDGQSLYSANNLSDNLGIVSDLRASRRLTRIPLRRPGSTQFVYPYDVTLITRGLRVSKIYVSLWGDGSIASVDPAGRVRHITVDRHPTKMLLDKQQTRLYVVNSNADAVSVIDTRNDAVIERINVRLSESAEIGASPEGLALSEDEQTLFVASAHANAVAVVSLTKTPSRTSRSKLLGFIPTGKYPSAVAVIGKQLFVANGKGTGVENSSNTVNDSGWNPNMPNGNFPGTRYNKRGQYSASVVSGNI
ncbi:MAG: beta-propeller fold lactonase family protein, partial [Acidobacteriota bacterium]